MNNKAKRWWLRALVLLAGGIVVLNVLAYNHAYAMMHFVSGGVPLCGRG